MKPTYHYGITQNTPEWDNIRRGMITASAASLLLTSSGKPAANDTSRAYIDRLVGERISGVSEQGVYTAAMANGHMLEPMARAIYAEHYAPVTECGFVTRKVSGGAMVGYSPDGLVGKDGLIEIKTRQAKFTIRTAMNATVDPSYSIQCQAGMMVTNRQWVDYISYSPGLPLVCLRLFRDETIIESIQNAVVAAEEKIVDTIKMFEAISKSWPKTQPIQTEINESFTF